MDPAFGQAAIFFLPEVAFCTVGLVLAYAGDSMRVGCSGFLWRVFSSAVVEQNYFGLNEKIDVAFVWDVGVPGSHRVHRSPVHSSCLNDAGNGD